LFKIIARRADLLVGILISGLFALNNTVGLPTLENVVATEPVYVVFVFAAAKSVLALTEVKV